MGIPDYQKFMLPLLRMLSDGEEHRIREAYEPLAIELGLDENARRELLPSGSQPVYQNRIGWAKTYLLKAGLLESPRRGVVNITSLGKDILRHNPARIDNEFLMQFPQFVEFKTTKADGDTTSGEAPTMESGEQTPEEKLQQAHQELRRTLAHGLLQQVRESAPAFFERLVIDLLVRMGYGGSREDAGRVVGRSGDGGIDGIINEDRLGLDSIYVQAKRWEGSIGRPEIQKFVGALQGFRARKGVFLTTSGFTKEAAEYARNIDSKVVLIDGQRLAELMIDFDIGVAAIETYIIKQIDSDYFEAD